MLTFTFYNNYGDAKKYRATCDFLCIFKFFFKQDPMRPQSLKMRRLNRCRYQQSVIIRTPWFSKIKNIIFIRLEHWDDPVIRIFSDIN